MITKEKTIEELINEIPSASVYPAEQGIRCIRCGEPIWGTLEDAAKEKGYNAEQIQVFVNDLNDLLTNTTLENIKIEKRFDFENLKNEK
jgi:hypothetical protein